MRPTGRWTSWIVPTTTRFWTSTTISWLASACARKRRFVPVSRLTPSKRTGGPGRRISPTPGMANACEAWTTVAAGMGVVGGAMSRWPSGGRDDGSPDGSPAATVARSAAAGISSMVRSLVVVFEKGAERGAEQATLHRHAGRRGVGGLGQRWVIVHRLDADATGAGETVPEDVASAGEEAGREALELGLHLDRVVLVNPAARLDVQLLSRGQFHGEHVAVAVEPDDPLALGRGERVDEESAAAEEHVRHTLDAVKRVFDRRGRGQELVLTDADRHAGLEVQGHDLSGPVAAEGDVARAAGLGHEDRETGEDAGQ